MILITININWDPLTNCTALIYGTNIQRSRNIAFNIGYLGGWCNILTNISCCLDKPINNTSCSTQSSPKSFSMGH